MNRIEIEATLSRDRAGLLDRFAALSADDLTRDATPSEHDASTSWSAKDHLAHLIGIERSFNGMIRRSLDGDAEPVGFGTNPDGSSRSRDEVMAAVHRGNEEWVSERRSKSLSELVAEGEQARAETLALLAELSDEQLQQKLPGAPWADGTLGGVLSANAGHGRQHWSWLSKGLGISADETQETAEETTPETAAETTPAQTMAALFGGKSTSEQMALLAELERGGAALYRAFAQDEKDAAARDVLLAAAAREEENAEVLEARAP